MKPARFAYFAIVAGMRTGSNLLERSLAQFPDITAHGELFNRSFIGRVKQKSFLNVTMAQRDKNPLEFLEAVVNSDRTKLHGFRIFQDHDTTMMAHVLSDPVCGKIILQRDALQSFISLKIAQKTNEWMRGKGSLKESPKITFDPEEFALYAGAIKQFGETVRRRLQVAGQTAFWVTYDEIKEAEILNGVGQFLGVEQKLKHIRQPLARQNPGPIADRVNNPEDLPVQLDQPPNRAAMVTNASSVKNFILSPILPLVYSPIPAGPEGFIVEWMQAIGAAGVDHVLKSGLNRGEFALWRRERANITHFTCISHPLIRAYKVFTKHILSDGPHAFAHIRHQLVQRYGMVLDQAVNAETVGQAFRQFLKFLELNLGHDTDIRVDRSWIPQAHLIGYSAEHLPIGLVVKEPNWPAAADYLARLLGVSPIALLAHKTEQPAILLSSIYTKETEALARRAYAIDYKAFAWPDLPYAACEF